MSKLSDEQLAEVRPCFVEAVVSHRFPGVQYKEAFNLFDVTQRQAGTPRFSCA